MNDDWKGESLIRHKSEAAAISERKRLVSKIAHANRRKAGGENPAAKSHKRLVTSIFLNRGSTADA